MRKYSILFFLFMIMTAKTEAQTNSDLFKTTIMEFKNVKTQSVNIEGTEFFYRKLGENNTGTPLPRESLRVALD